MIMRRIASTSLSDPSGCMVVLTLILIENAGHSPAFIYEAEGFVLKRFKEFDFYNKLLFFFVPVDLFNRFEKHFARAVRFLPH